MEVRHQILRALRADEPTLVATLAVHRDQSRRYVGLKIREAFGYFYCMTDGKIQSK